MAIIAEAGYRVLFGERQPVPSFSAFLMISLLNFIPILTLFSCLLLAAASAYVSKAVFPL
jgi:hypothetical protein